MWLTIVLEWHLLRGSNVKIRLNTPSLGFTFQQRECTTSRREFVWKNFYSARIMFSPQMLSRFCFPAGFSPGSRKRVFLLAGSQRVQISRRVRQSNDWCSIGFDCRTVRLDRSGVLSLILFLAADLNTYPCSISTGVAYCHLHFIL